MRKVLGNKYLMLTSRIVLAVIFIFAGIEKISDPLLFAKSIYNYRLLPENMINLVAVILPWVEIVAGILLLFGFYLRENAFIINFLLIVFTILIIISVSRGLNIECGCFGTLSGSRVGWQKILENAGLILLGIHILYLTNAKKVENSHSSMAIGKSKFN